MSWSWKKRNRDISQHRNRHKIFSLYMYFIVMHVTQWILRAYIIHFFVFPRSSMISLPLTHYLYGYRIFLHIPKIPQPFTGRNKKHVAVLWHRFAFSVALYKPNKARDQIQRWSLIQTFLWNTHSGEQCPDTRKMFSTAVTPGRAKCWVLSQRDCVRNLYSLKPGRSEIKGPL